MAIERRASSWIPAAKAKRGQSYLEPQRDHVDRRDSRRPRSNVCIKAFAE